MPGTYDLAETLRSLQQAYKLNAVALAAIRDALGSAYRAGREQGYRSGQSDSDSRHSSRHHDMGQ